MSLILAIDTCTRRASIALRDGSVLRAELTWEAQRQETAFISARIQEMLRACHVQPSDLDAIAVAIGPGSFTGVRAGLAIGKGLALVHGLPMIGLTAFDVLAAAQPHHDLPMLVLLEAGRARVAVCRYEWQGATPAAASEWWIQDWRTLLSTLEPPLWVCGEIPAEFIELAQQRVMVAPPALCLRRAGFLADLAYERWKNGDVSDAFSLAAIYPAEA